MLEITSEKPGREYKNPAPENQGRDRLTRGTTLLALQAARISGTERAHSIPYPLLTVAVRRGLLDELSTCCSWVYFSQPIYRVSPPPGSLKDVSDLLIPIIAFPAILLTLL